MGIINEFKEFAVKGNVVDMAVGVIIGAAFGKIVSSLVADVVTPPIGLLVGGVDFSKLELVLRQAAGDQAAVVLKYGVFLQASFDFLIVSMAIFAMVKVINRLKRTKDEPPPAPPEPTAEEKLLTEIRDLLKAK
ncbi:MAG TPA: large-conductance mechanosensitive channel protein MscL [Polyangiaceae bacterium]|jgi:large conductance mechanosensitive channel|nr:MAG: Large-conductance mechanosensitive channel [Deltaproteobacteria bacterium ADurb.Bin207]HNS96691.1 large-conductance mechanosensitive channel protein MscL [Polyangiaceae bacterium]HNZ24308.1 large-conductance mechanosensitive channel protein MscL [Polyangiaceae bacterium]HOD25383.1 large-conductance mechanosensitive channel protein MscL [Polyangiaceae bacterium]HOE49658.1 large-conductance mechanosensitive channel protein MscL [Polyangiaceae bacterium]